MASNIKSILSEKITADERGAIERIKYTSQAMATMADTFIQNPDNILPKIKEVYRKPKKSNKEWGYLVNDSDAGYLYVLAKRFGVSNICDLGCGMGIILKAMSIEYLNFEGTGFKNGFSVTGYDNEETLLKMCNSLHTFNVINKAYATDFRLKDITKLNESDIPNDSIIYWWLPIHDWGLSEKFISNIVKVAKKGQIFVVAGFGELLERNGCVNYGAFSNSTLEVLKKV